MKKKWATLREKMTPQRREANRQAAQQMIAVVTPEQPIGERPPQAINDFDFFLRHVQAE